MSTSNAAIETKGVTKTFGGFTAVNKVTYSLAQKEVAGIIGPNGAGKTTFFNLITGAYIPDEGSVFYGDRDVTKVPPQGRVSLGVRRTFQLASTFDNLKVVDNLKLAYFRTYKGSSIASMLCTKMDSIADKAIVDQLARFGLSGVAETATRNLSLGDKRKLEMAMALIGKPTVLLLDEPFAGLSEREIDETIDILRDYVHKISILIVEHKITKLKTFVERVTVLASGEIIADGGFEEVLRSPAVRKSYWQID
ncbi:MAG: ABC transporter ATP-binding protein [Firmicutes bacterium]|jgi:branched-chain amino acid transport system ATP-binding protein|nr:ABC transporter ATP-binding protein [Bacillota bacterium]MDH7496472.1 ABC transporter ATP-binding protein [Bacillota bacterium]